MNEPSPAAAKLAADVVVIGGGGSGLAAAIEAASLGRSVVLVEKAARLGGSTALSVGSITATNTPQQLRQGILDSPQAHFEDLQKFNQGVGLADNAKLSRLLVDNVPETVRWLMSMGVEFFGPMNELPHRKPRMHVVLPNSRAYIFHLGRRARALGVDIRTSVRASAFIVADGRVTGIRCQTPDGPLEIHARGGVVLCSGDYSASEDKRARYLGSHMKAVNPVNIHNTGDGQDMVEALGGSVVNRQLYLAGIRFQAPPAKWIHNLPPNRLLTRCMRLMLERLPGAIVRPFIMSFLTGILVPSPKLLQSGAMLVNRNGERFGDELDAPGPRIAQQPEQIAYLVFDAKLAARFSGWPNYVSTAPGFAYASIADYRRNRKDIFHEAATSRGPCRQHRRSRRRAHAHRGGVQHVARAGTDGQDGGRPRAVRRDRASPIPDQLHRRRCRRVGRTAGPRQGRATRARPLCSRIFRNGWRAARRPRPPPRMGVHLRTPGRPQGRV
ncbi:MAG: FAD-dependent oxidoreductase [Betaproteobacteria bacterium]|nr:FAD-dependent oxidoreductase [Betaproteobacteria bacterium]